MISTVLLVAGFTFLAIFTIISRLSYHQIVVYLKKKDINLYRKSNFRAYPFVKSIQLYVDILSNSKLKKDTYLRSKANLIQWSVFIQAFAVLLLLIGFFL